MQELCTSRTWFQSSYLEDRGLTYVGRALKVTLSCVVIVRWTREDIEKTIQRWNAKSLPFDWLVSYL